MFVSLGRAIPHPPHTPPLILLLRVECVGNLCHSNSLHPQHGDKTQDTGMDDGGQRTLEGSCYLLRHFVFTSWVFIHYPKGSEFFKLLFNFLNCCCLLAYYFGMERLSGFLVHYISRNGSPHQHIHPLCEELAGFSLLIFLL